ncbi:hypothetical protein IW261DRAFT_1423173 [Armillaria novae-zelandiae]|uniref:Uncharacterized protein n=1 Tax=Armillaria novae-zelandiae TaxID=153914 RepID=A0AA39NZ63_9AGAR|nr:hypothetical protein IW261DRAFT_1423173 [Armillaria novae-zelandiae]
MARTDKLFNPVHNIAYSAGKPSGQSKGHKYSVMLGRDGKPVPCLVDYSTCQGIRICPFVSDDIKITSHTEGTLFKRPWSVMNRTVNTMGAFRTNTLSCILLSRGGYNFEYLCALIVNDEPIISKIELQARQQGYGLLMSCTTVRNISSVKRTGIEISMVRPEDGYWEECPKILLICHSPHTHPIPLPTTTPVQIKAEIKALICSLKHELADMTPQCFCRHPAVINRVKELCPAVKEPMVAHLHPLLANLDHIASYIHNDSECVHSATGHWVRISSTSICTLLLSRSIEGYCTGQLTNISRQAKGLGLHLQDIAREMGKEQRDLHEPGLLPIQLRTSCAGPDYMVKEKMHSLLCACSIQTGMEPWHILNEKEELRDEVAQKMGVKASYRPTTIMVSVTRKYKHTERTALLSIKPTDLNAIESAEKHKKAYEKHKQKSLDLKKRLHGQSSGKVRIVILE